MPLDPFTASNLSEHTVPHGFFTRKGGISAGVYNSLNCGYGAKDDAPENVNSNRTKVAEHLGGGKNTLITVHQVHSATAVLATAGMPPVEADALVTKQTGATLGILTADCTPVLFYDHQARVIGAAHAGWRGATGGILQATLDLMCAQGAKPENIYAAIGPTIHQKNYEVDQKFFDTLIHNDRTMDKFFTPSHREHHFLFDLPGFVEQDLRRAGVTHIETIPVCTYENDALFFSYRRNTHQDLEDYGRQISAIALPHA